MRGNKNDRSNRKNDTRMIEVLEIFKKAMAIKDELSKFDRALADAVKPLTDLTDKNIYENVIDKFSQGHDKKGDAEELQKAIDRMQVQLTKNYKALDKIEKRINEGFKPIINSKITLTKGNEEIFN